MKVKDFYELGLIKDNTKVWIRSTGGFKMKVLAYGNWYHDDVLKYIGHEVESFIWQDDDTVFIDIK